MDIKKIEQIKLIGINAPQKYLAQHKKYIEYIHNMDYGVTNG